MRISLEGEGRETRERERKMREKVPGTPNSSKKNVLQ